MREQETDELPEVHLQDVTEEEAGAVAPPVSTRKKKLLMVGGLVGLLLLTAVGGYFLLRGKEVSVKATRSALERVTNGNDLQQAAYDSLRGSLASAPPVTAGQNPAANIGTNQPATIAIAGVTPAASVSPTPQASMPIQAGIAMTIAPPSELAVKTPAAKIEGALPSPTMVSAQPKTVAENPNPKGSNKLLTTASIVFASVPAAPRSKTERPDTQPRVLPPHDAVLTPAKVQSGQPGFGALLPVRLLGMLFTLRTNTFVRLELLRASNTAHGQLPRGTIFVGAVQGASRDRAYVQIKGFIDPTTERFTKLEGEALGSDGGAGLRGKERRLSSIWLRVLDRAAQTGTQLLTSLLGRSGSQVIVAADPAGLYRSAMSSETSVQNNRSFVEVPAGAVGFVLVTTLPTALPAAAPTVEKVEPQNEVSDAELATLLSTADAAQIRAALPRLNPDVRRALERTLPEMER